MPEKRDIEAVFKISIRHRLDEGDVSITTLEVEQALINTFSGHDLVAIGVTHRGTRDV